MADAWGGSWGASWGSSWGAGTVAATGGAVYSGGWIDLPTGRNKKKHVDEERERLGIVPKKAQAIIKKVVAAQIVAPRPDGDVALREAFMRANYAYQALYAEFYRQELQKQRDRDDEETFLLLM